MLHTEHKILEAFARGGVYRLRLFLKPFGAGNHLVILSHFYADREIAARIRHGVPAEFFLGATTYAKCCARQNQSFLGKDGAANEKVVGVTRGRAGLLLRSALCGMSGRSGGRVRR